MLKRSKRALSLGLAMAMLFMQTAYADSVVTATQPGGADGHGSFLSDSGPNGTKIVGENGYVVVGSDGRNANEYVNAGPGAGGAFGTGVNSSSNGQTTVIGGGQSAGGTAQQGSESSGTAAGTQQIVGGQITIDQSIVKPQIASEAAILYDATTGQVLYGKNQDKVLYPASTTKLMTALLTVENLQLTDTVTYSQTATHGLESGASNVQLDTGDTLTVKDSLYALLLKSACEVANGLAEKVAGTQTAFAQRMNQRAKELGCKNTNFTNASGLNDANHHTTVYDMALITKAALDNETIRTINMTQSYTLPAAKNRGQLKIVNGHKMLNPSDSRYYQGVIGGKTGYTSKAGNTLTTAMIKDGHELIAVVFKSTQKQYDDTKALFDYGAKLLSAAKGTGSQTGTQAPNTNSGSQQNGTGWIKVSDTQWQYKKANGQLCKSEWLDLSGNTYWFDDNTYMATGWRHFSNGDYYYFNPENGAMVTEKWVTDNGKSYYMQKNGTMAKNTVITNANGSYQVDENGVYVKKLQ